MHDSRLSLYSPTLADFQALDGKKMKRRDRRSAWIIIDARIKMENNYYPGNGKDDAGDTEVTEYRETFASISLT